MGALWRARASLSSRVKRQFYFAFVQSKLSYASNAMFPSLSQSCLNSLLSVSRNAIRAFNNLPRTSSTLPVFDRLNIRPLDQFLAYKCAVFVYRCLNSLSSPLFRDYFAVSPAHQTRGSSQHLLVVPFWRGPAGRATIQFRGSIWWNNLPASVRTSPTLSLFRTALRHTQIDPTTTTF